MSLISIRADGGPSIGFGHIIRCLALASQFKKMGHNVIFLSNIAQGIERIKHEGFKVIKLYEQNINEKDETNLKEEAKNLLNYIKKTSVDYLIIDSYNVNKDYFLEFKGMAKKVIYIDDLNKFAYPVDVLVNYNINAEDLKYDDIQKKQIRLLGVKYALLRKQFQELPKRQIKEQINEIMVTSGGSDPYNICIFIVNAILAIEEMKETKINVVIGDGFQNVTQLKKIASENSNIKLCEHLLDLSQIMIKCDVAISAGGSTLYELCACGTPTIAYVLADNQQEIVNCMGKHNYIETLGWYNKISSQDLKSKIVNLSKDLNMRKELSYKMQSLVDGKGAARVAESILSY